MDLKELKAFQTILQEGTFSKAAAKLNYAQSTITNQIQRLERELGIQLFKRGWEAELTPSGKLFAQEVDKLIGHWAAVADQAKALQKEEIGTLNIGFIEALPADLLPGVLRRFREAKPKIVCNFSMGNTDSLSKQIREQQLDIALCGEPLEPGAYYFELMYEENIAFIARHDHPLSEKEGPVGFEELLPFPLMVGGPTCLYHLRLAKQLSHYEKTPFLYTMTSISSIPAYVEQVDCIGVVLASTPLPSGIVKLATELNDPILPVGLLQLRKEQYPSSAKQLFKQLVKEELLKKSAAD